MKFINIPITNVLATELSILKSKCKRFSVWTLQYISKVTKRFKGGRQKSVKVAATPISILVYP